MYQHLLDCTEERLHKVRLCEMKLSDAFGRYCSSQGESHKKWIKNAAEKDYEEAVLRWQDLESLKYDPKDKWDLNFDDYDEDVIQKN